MHSWWQTDCGPLKQFILSDCPLGGDLTAVAAGSAEMMDCVVSVILKDTEHLCFVFILINQLSQHLALYTFTCVDVCEQRFIFYCMHMFCLGSTSCIVYGSLRLTTADGFKH